MGCFSFTRAILRASGRRSVFPLISMLLVSCFFIAARAGAEMVYYAPFDGSTAMEQAEGPVAAEGQESASYARGRRGEALLIGSEGGSALSYFFEEPFLEDEGSVEFWFRPEDWRPAPGREAFRMDITAGDGAVLSCFEDRDSSNIVFSMTSGGLTESYFAPGYSIRPGEWQQVLITRSGDAAALYLNGERAARKGHGNAPGSGEGRNSVVFHFNSPALLDELRIYSGSFGDMEAAERYISSYLGRVAYRNPSIRIPYTQTPPVSAGGVDESVWERAAVASDFIHMRSAERARQQTWVHMMYDDERVYILYRSPVYEGGLMGGPRARDVLDGGDEVEFFVMPEYTETFDFYQFIGNAWESKFDSLRRDRRDWRGDWFYRCSVDDEWWLAELWVNDYGMLETAAPVEGAVWTGNFCRNWRSGEEAGTAGGWTQWSQTPMGYHTHGEFGTIIFGGAETVIPRVETIARTGAGEVSAVFRLINASGESKKLTARYEFYPAGDYLPMSTQSREITLGGGREEDVRLTCRMGGASRGLVSLQITGDGGEVYFSQMVNIDAEKEDLR